MAGDASGSTRADALVHGIGQAILADPAYAGDGWTAIALVIEVAPRRRMYGYLYAADAWEAQTPDGFGVIALAAELAAATETDGRRFARALVQIVRPGPRIEISFAHHGDAWAVTPANHRAMADALRPRP